MTIDEFREYMVNAAGAFHYINGGQNLRVAQPARAREEWLEEYIEFLRKRAET